MINAINQYLDFTGKITKKMETLSETTGGRAILLSIAIVFILGIVVLVGEI